MSNKNFLADYWKRHLANEHLRDLPVVGVVVCGKDYTDNPLHAAIAERELQIIKKVLDMPAERP